MSDCGCAAAPYQVSGWSEAGIQPSSTRVTAFNDKYFAYATITSVIVRDIHTYDIINEISYENDVPTTIALSYRNQDLLAVSTKSEYLYLYNVFDDITLKIFSTKKELISLSWFQNDEKLVCYPATFMSYFIVDIAKGNIKEKSGFFENMRILASPRNIDKGNLLLGGNYIGTITLVKSNGSHKQMNTEHPIVSVDIDPFNDTTGLVANRKGTIYIFDINQELTILHQNQATNSLAKACWLRSRPGQYITSERNIGVIQVWNAASTSPLETHKISTSPIQDMLSLFDDDVFICFRDGETGIYNLNTREFKMKLISPHRSTVFQFGFLKTDPNVMLTCSADSSVCTWNVKDMMFYEKITCSSGTHTDRSMFYCMDISPGAGILVCGTKKGMLYCISLQNQLLLFKDEIFHDICINSVSIDPNDPKLVLVVGHRSACVIFNIEERRVIWESDFDGPFRAAYSPYVKGMFCVFGKDGNVFISQNEKSSTINAIEGAATCVAYSPHNYNQICLSSSTGVVSIFDINEPESRTTAKIHNDLIIHVIFHPYFDDILITAGKDRKIYILNTHTLDILAHFHMHTSYISCITVPPENPLLLLTASCDSSIRFLSLDRVFKREQISKILEDSYEYITPLRGNDQLLNLAHRCNKSKKLTFKRNDIHHANDTTRLNSKYVKKMLKSSQQTSIVKRAIQIKDKNIEAAKIELSLGNIKGYCELMFCAGEYAKATAAAPAVSYEFWREMCKAYSDILEDKDEIANVNIAMGDIENALEYIDNIDDKFSVSVASCTGAYNSIVERVDRGELQFDSSTYIDLTFETDKYNEYRIASSRCNFYLKQGQIVLGACSYLAIGDVISATRVLNRSALSEISYIISKIINIKDLPTIKKFLRVCSLYDNEITLLRKLNLKVSELEEVVGIIFVNTRTDLDIIYDGFDMEKTDEYIRKQAKDTFTSIKYQICSARYDDAVNMYITQTKVLIIRTDLDLASIDELSNLVTMINPKNLSQNVISELVAITTCLGFYKAIFRSYFILLDIIYSNIEFMKNNLKLPYLQDFLDIIKPIKAIFSNKASAKIYSIGCKYHNSMTTRHWDKSIPYGQSYYYDQHKLPYEYALMWADIIPYSMNSSSYSYIKL